LVAFSASSVWGDGDLPDLSGTYNCKGQDVGGEEYTATVEIEKHEETYKISWVMSEKKFIGVGLQTPNLLSVCWASRGNAGVMVYQIREDGKLIGRWALLNGKGSVQKETLSPVKKSTARE
jgi:hypothetical protein